MNEAASDPRRMPERPTLEGLEERWSQRWQEEGTYTFDRSADRVDVYSIDTPPPTVSGSLHLGHVFSYTHTDITARFRRMLGKVVFYPMGFDDNGLPTERRVQQHFGVRPDPTLADSEQADGRISRRAFLDLCERLTAEDERAYETLWRRLGLSVDWSYTYRTIDDVSRTEAQREFL